MPPLAFQTEPPSLHEQQFRCQALQAVIAISLVTSVFALMVGFPLNWNVSIKIGLTFLIVKNVVFLLWLRSFPQQYALVGGTHFLILAATGIYKFGQAVMIDHVARGLGNYSYWLPLVYVVAFLAFSGRVALGASLGVFATLAAIVLSYVATGTDDMGLKRENSVLLIQVLLTHATFISFFLLFGVLQNRYVSAIAEAQSEARAGYLDVLTNVANRRQLMLWLTSRQNRAETTGEPLCVILFDLDRFKHINDTYGHDYGDEVLKRTAAAVAGALRRGTLFGRWGGEEFLVVLPATARGEARGVAERIRHSVAEVRYDLPVQVTVSLGVAQAQPGENLQALLKRADEAMYAAKHAGRNQVQAA
ncbi:putative regulator protein, GGDEF domain; putative membrane protein [Deinococcus deserti VCD115]|uniref:Putative regulator protein, GGDEF domain putative membrane protein n=2 Tax=Deinococcus TaxID=1298 RepID=C1CZJ2_DEIDV|nr:putative regulator protein, GGDEF domain; putative membrane protein [Deinococcus deserti VCD115]